jgi:hypothetical protein
MNSDVTVYYNPQKNGAGIFKLILTVHTLDMLETRMLLNLTGHEKTDIFTSFGRNNKFSYKPRLPITGAGIFKKIMAIKKTSTVQETLTIFKLYEIPQETNAGKKCKRRCLKHDNLSSPIDFYNTAEALKSEQKDSRLWPFQ